jgi:hypothetical protein
VKLVSNIDQSNHIWKCKVTKSQIPSSPYERVGLDLLELSMEGKEVALVTTNHYSYFIKVDFLKSTTADIVVECCKRNFVRHGIPKVVVRDNGPQFISAEFGNFA